MSIDIRNFVDVNIVHHEQNFINSIRNTAVLITNEVLVNEKKNIIVTSINDYETQQTVRLTNTDEYVKRFFNNNGSKLHIYQLTDVTASGLKTLLLSLPIEEIVVTTTLGADYNTVIEAINNYQDDSSVYGINQKLFVIATKNGVIPSDERKAILSKSRKFIVVCDDGGDKYFTCMEILAYLTRINISEMNSVQQYSFTKVINLPKATLVEDDSKVKTYLENNINFNCTLVDTTRAVGGNTIHGDDLVNDFMLIVCQQTLTSKVMNVLMNKLKGPSGIAAIKTALAQELEKYVMNGYLTTDKVWENQDLVVSHNDKTYTILKANTPLLSGYAIEILPLSSLTQEEIAKHSSPMIYIVLATSYGIKFVSISGEVF